VSVFLERNHLFLRNPRGGVEDIEAMVSAGFGAIFCNVGDFPASDWEFIRERAAQHSVVCGPWLRTAVGGQGAFDPERLNNLIAIADLWNAPFIVNSESELKDTGADLTSYIAEVCGFEDWALSMEPWPFATVDWRPIKVPVLPQVFGLRWSQEAEAVREEWYRVGVRCVVSTFGSYGDSNPDWYDRLTPYGVYTADDIGQLYASWSDKGDRVACKESGFKPPTGGAVTQIGFQDGIKAGVNLMRDLSPSGTLLKKEGGKWQDISVLASVPLDQWKPWDKLQRTLQILKDDHDNG